MSIPFIGKSLKRRDILSPLSRLWKTHRKCHAVSIICCKNWLYQASSTCAVCAEHLNRQIKQAGISCQEIFGIISWIDKVDRALILVKNKLRRINLSIIKVSYSRLCRNSSLNRHRFIKAVLASTNMQFEYSQGRCWQTTWYYGCLNLQKLQWHSSNQKIGRSLGTFWKAQGNLWISTQTSNVNLLEVGHQNKLDQYLFAI